MIDIANEFNDNFSQQIPTLKNKHKMENIIYKRGKFVKQLNVKRGKNKKV